MGSGAGTVTVIDEQHPLRSEVRLLLQVAMAVFVWTVAIGILNGTDVVDFDRKVLLSHVHAGTLGWITTSVFGASLWLFGRGAGEGHAAAARLLARASIVVLPVFALTFAFTYEEPRAVLGTLALLAIVGMFCWVVARARAIELSTVHLGFLAAVATSVVGGIIGVLLATEIATGENVLTDGGSDAHPATMVVGFLIPVGMALAEWALRRGRLEPAGRLGTAQIALPFLGGVLLMVGLLFDVDPLPPMATVIELVGVAIFFRRLWTPLRALSWGERGPERYAAAGAVAIVANIIFLNYLVGANGGDIDTVPTHQILALDHTMFVGVLTNAIFALLLLAAPGRSRWPGLDNWVFGAMNAALVGFVVALLAESTPLMRVATPVLGAAILAGLLDRTLALVDGRAGTRLSASPMV
ncbi:MAG TPA: hypothetical protein VFV35_00325 [Acidimicrobiales bacterium]|nr:hypothetical protein [Acidimicrobiales bacterium]